MSGKGGKGWKRGISKSGGGAAHTRSSATLFDFDTEFPQMKEFSTEYGGF